MDEERKAFVEDYRLTACMNVLKWFVTTYNEQVVLLLFCISHVRLSLLIKTRGTSSITELFLNNVESTVSNPHSFTSPKIFAKLIFCWKNPTSWIPIGSDNNRIHPIKQNLCRCSFRTVSPFRYLSFEEFLAINGVCGFTGYEALLAAQLLQYQ